MPTDRPDRTDPIAIAARSYVRARDAEIARLDAKAGRLDVAWHSRDPWEPEADRKLRVARALAVPSRDGAPATARLDAKVRPIVATEYEGDPRVTGGLVRLRARVRPDLGRTQAQAARAVARADSAIATIERYRALRATMTPGGATWTRCNRDDRRRLRAVVHSADALASAGDLASAIETLRFG